MTECEKIVQAYLDYLGQGFKCYTEDEYVVLETPYLYPDGDTIQLFIELLSENRVRMSDLGETLRSLAMLNYKLSSRARKSQFNHILTSTGVRSNKGALCVVTTKEEAGVKMSDLLNGIRQVSSLVYTLRGYAAPTFREEVEGFIRAEGYDPQVDYEIYGDSGRLYRVHLYLDDRRRQAFRTLSAHTRAWAENQLNATYVMWDDIKLKHEDIQRITVIDDIDSVWTSEWLTLLRRVSEFVALWSKREALRSYLRETTLSR